MLRKFTAFDGEDLPLPLTIWTIEISANCKKKQLNIFSLTMHAKGGQQPKRGGSEPITWPNVAQNCMKTKKIGPGHLQKFTM